MTPARWRAIRRIVEQAMDVAIAEREEFVETRCGKDAALKREVQSLLEADASAPAHFLELPSPVGTECGIGQGLPRRLGPCRLVRELGRGATATVFLAEMLEDRPFAPTGTMVAVKVLQPLGAATPHSLSLEREAALASAVEHPALVRTHDHGVVQVDDRPVAFAIQEYVEGRTLRELMEELGPFPEPLLHHVGLHVAEALAALHAVGAVHRDLKPENILIAPDSTVRLIDLGIAWLPEELAPPSDEPVDFVGSAAYAAPEQFTGERVGPCTDLHALGVVLHEAATGDRPFAGGSFEACKQSHLEQVPARLGNSRPELTVLLEELVAGLLAKDPAERLGPAALVAEILRLGEASPWWAERSRVLCTIRAARRRRMRVDLPLVGRHDELERLDRSWTAARSTRGRLVLVKGEAGIGKSRLIAEFLDRCEAQEPAPDVLFAAPDPAVDTAATALVRSLIDRFGPIGLDRGLDELLPPEARAQVAEFVTAPSGPARPSVNMRLGAEEQGATLALVGLALAERRPTIWVVEDLHCLGRPGLESLLSLASCARDGRLLVVASTRDELPPGAEDRLLRLPESQTIVLDRLPRDQSLHLVRECIGTTPSAEELASSLAERCDGIPLFALELVHELRVRGKLELLHEDATTAHEALSELQLPKSLQTLVESELEGLDLSDRAILETAAILGVRLDVDLIAESLGFPVLQVLEALGRLRLRRGLVIERSGSYELRHQVLRDSILRGLSTSTRAEHHLRVGTALSRRADGARCESEGEHAVRLAHHFSRSSTPRRALPHVRRALRHLTARDAHEACLALAEQAIRCVPHGDEALRRDLLLSQATSLHQLGRRDDERALLDQADASARADGDESGLARVLHARAKWLQAVGEAEEAVRLFKEVVHRARGVGEDSLETTALSSLGECLHDAGDYAASGAIWRQLMRRAEARGDRRLQGAGLARLADLHYHSGEFRPALELLDEAVPLLEELGHRRRLRLALVLRGNVLWSIGKTHEAVIAYEASLALAKRIGARSGEMATLINMGGLLLDLGRYREGIEHAERARQLAHELDDSREESLILGTLGVLHDVLGDFPRARECYEDSLALARSVGDRQREALALLQLAERARLEGDLGTALAACQEGIELLRAVGDQPSEWTGLATLSIIHAARDELEEALSLGETTLDWMKGASFMYGRAELVVNLGRCRLAQGREEDARELFIEADAINEEPGLGFVIAALLTLVGARPVDSAVAPPTGGSVASLAAGHVILARVRSDEAHVRRAREHVERLCAHLEGEARERFWRRQPVARELLEIERRLRR